MSKFLMHPWGESNYSPKIVRSNGSYLLDSNSKKYFDLTSGSFSHPFGHGPKKIINDIKNQLLKSDFVPIDYDSKIRDIAAKNICQSTDLDFHKVFFSPGGAEAVEAAIKFARNVTGKLKIISANNSYHGSTYGAQSASGDLTARKNSGLPKGFSYFNNFDYYLEEGCDLDTATELGLLSLEKSIENSAAVLIEPITGVNGFHIPRKDYLKTVKKICKENDSLLIFDEVLTGFMRTGSMYAYQLFNQKSDIICLGKSITSGLIPQGATLTSKQVSRKMEESPIPLGHTNSGHNAACRAISSTIHQIAKLRLARKILVANKKLLNTLPANSSIKEIRMIGLLGAYEFQNDISNLKKKMLSSGLLCSLEKNNLLPIAPRLDVTEVEILDLTTRLSKLLELV